MIRFVIWKWKPQNETFRYREEYTAKHVNIFANMIDRNISIPYEIVCITDDPTGIDGGIKTIPIWDDLIEYQMCYRRLRIFSEEMADLIGPKFISMDIDCVIVNNITPIVKFEEDFKICHPRKNKTPYCGSMFGMKAGTKSHIWHEFDRNDLVWLADYGGRITGKSQRWVHRPAYDAGFIVGSDQSYISYKLWPDVATWGADDGVLNFNQHFRVKNSKINDAKIIFFPGIFDPSHTGLYEKYPWIEKYWK